MVRAKAQQRMELGQAWGRLETLYGVGRGWGSAGREAGKERKIVEG